jgi:hypothetical protein
MAGIKYQEAIGRRPKRGRPAAGPAPSKADLVKLYVQEGRTVREVAAVLETSLVKPGQKSQPASFWQMLLIKKGLIYYSI